MKEIKVKIKKENKYHLIIQEQAQKDDIINLKNCNINWIDYIESDEINNLKHTIKDLNTTISKQKADIENYDKLNEEKNKRKDIEFKKNISDEKNKMQEQYHKQIENLNTTINVLKRDNVIFNTKLLGNDLENWCDAEVKKHQTQILDNVDWIKDNKPIKGTKGDFIYKVYLDKNKNENEILTSVMLEMKTEEKDLSGTKTKTKNSSHLSKLDKDRNDKKMEFAILVSELEIDPKYDVPIKKVEEYDKMYIIRPSYLTAFLNIITALANKHKEIINKKKTEEIKFEDERIILNNFQNMKDVILNNSITNIKKNLNTIVQQNEKIKEHGDKILKSSEDN